MADLKLGTQIGGNLVWHQGILDLNPVDTKLYFQDQEVLVDTGYQTLKGTMKFSVPANQYDIESLSILPAGSKSMLRKFRGGINDTIWHETVQSDAYRISRGTTDTDLVMQLTGTGATFQNAVLTNAVQSSAANSFTRKDFVNSEDAKKVNKAGDGMTGNLDFNLDSQGIRVNFPGGSISTNTGIMGGQGDGASRTKTNMQIKSWWGVGFSPSGDGTAVSPGDNSIWFDTRNGNMYTIGRMHVGSDQEVYSPLNKPTPGDINAYTKAEIDEKGWFRVKDERAAMIAPNALQSKTVAAYFTNRSDVTTNWVSGFTVNGWESTYAAWSLFSSARSDADDARLWFKYGRTAWSPSYRIYHENNKPTNVELNLVSRAGDEMTGPLTIRNSTFQCVNGWGVRRVMKQLGYQNDAKPVLVLFCPKYIGAALPKSGFVGRVTFDRGATTSTLQANYVDLSAVTAYAQTDAQIHYASGGTPVKLVYVTHNGVEYLAMYRVVASEATLNIDGYCYGADPILISDATGYVVTDIETRERIYSSNNKPTNVDLNLVSRAGDTLTGSLNGPDFIQTTPQSSNGAASTRKDYVDAQDAKTVAKAGDTMTGALIATQFKASSDYGFVRSTNNDQGMFVGGDGRTIIGGGTGALILRPQGISNAASESVFNNDGTIAISQTGTADNHLVTKKYVDDKVGTAVQSVTATGAVKSTGGINPVISLANATNAADGAMSFADKAKLDGIPAAAVNRTGDTMTGDLTAPKVLVSGAQGTEVNALTRRDYVNAELAKKLNLTGGTLTGNLTAPAVLVSSAQNTLENALTRKDYVDTQLAAKVSTSQLVSGNNYATQIVGKIPSIASDGVLEIGQILDFHRGGTNEDFSMRLDATIAGVLSVAGGALKVGTSTVYHQGFKPTAAEVGAAPAGFGLGGYGTTISSVLGDTPLRRQSGFFQGSYIEGLPTSPHTWNYVFNQAHGNSAGYFGYLAISFAGTQAWIGGQEGGAQKGPYELVKQYDRFVANNAAGNDFNQCAIEVNGNTAINSRPGIGFHMAGRFASTLHLWEGGDFRFHTQGLTTYAAIMTGNVNANDVYIRSDIRLKRNLVRVAGALDKTCSLTAYSYDKKQTLKSTDYDKHEVGLIAQDVEKVLPAAISYIEDSDAETGATTLMISNSAVTALLVEAIKELTDRVKYLESKIN